MFPLILMHMIATRLLWLVVSVWLSEREGELVVVLRADGSVLAIEAEGKVSSKFV